MSAKGQKGEKWDNSDWFYVSAGAAAMGAAAAAEYSGRSSVAQVFAVLSIMGFGAATLSKASKVKYIEPRKCAVKDCACNVHLIDATSSCCSGKDIPVKIWPLPKDFKGYCYPELQDESGLKKYRPKNFGIALSGGGMRAETMALGWLRGLYELGALQQARYLSSNSGGGWTNGPYSYRSDSISDAEFLGVYIPPEQFTIENLYKDNGMMGKSIADTNLLESFLMQLVNSSTSASASSCSSSCSDEDYWSRAIAMGFFKPFALDSAAMLPTMHHDRPFPILCGSCQVDDRAVGYVPFEMTAMYCGVPVQGQHQDGAPIGGLFIECTGFTSQPSEECLQTIRTASASSSSSSAAASSSSVCCTVPEPVHVLSVSQQAGLSSGAVADGVAMMRTELLEEWLVPKLPTWNLQTSGELKVVDGGANDNLGIYPLLRRGVEHIVCCVSNHNCIHRDDITADDASAVAQVAALFGCMSSHGPENVGNESRRVLREEDWPVVLKGLRDRHHDAGSCFYLYEGPVLPNERIGVVGGYTVQILFVVFSKSKMWFSSLSDDMRSHIREEQAKAGAVSTVESIFGGDAALEDFPYYSTMDLNYSPELVNAMSQLAAWEIMQCRDALVQMKILA